MNYQNHQQKFPFDNSNPQPQQSQPAIQVPLFQQMYYAQQQQIYGYDQQPFPSLHYNGYQYYGQPQSKQLNSKAVPQYNIPHQPTPVDSLSSNSISLSGMQTMVNQDQGKKKKRGKSDKIKKDKKKKKKRGSLYYFINYKPVVVVLLLVVVILIVAVTRVVVGIQSSIYSHRRKKKSLAFLHNEDNWKCKYCYNINFPHRTECNRCKKSREQAVKEDKGKKYVPNPDDWKCNICGNFNYARREKCNRCKEDKPKAILQSQLQP